MILITSHFWRLCFLHWLLSVWFAFKVLWNNGKSFKLVVNEILEHSHFDRLADKFYIVIALAYDTGIKLSLISFWLHCECDGVADWYPEPSMRLLLCVMPLIPRTQPGIMRYASWHWCLAYCIHAYMCIALQSSELDFIAYCHICFMERAFVQNFFCWAKRTANLCFLFNIKESLKENFVSWVRKIVICPLQAGGWCHDLQVSQIPLKRKRRQEQIGLWGGDEGHD